VGRRKTAVTSAAGLVLAALVCVPGAAASAPAAPADEPVRILVVGDSMTQGSAGDWTWRYRLWQHLVGAGVSIDFVGPRDDLWDNVTGDFGSHAYVDPDFDRDHAARWGMSMTFPDIPIDELVDAYQPDVVVEMLGVNDLQFLGETPADTEGVLRGFIADARSADPDVDLVLARVPQPWLPKVVDFNARIDTMAAELTTPDSRIVSAQSDAGLVREEDTWELAHPNAHGDVKIAAGVADALSTLGIGPPAARPLPVVPRGPRIPPVLAATSSPRNLHLSWLRSPGAQQSEVWLRDLTAGEEWRLVAAHVTDTTFDVAGLPGWHRFQARVVPIKWNWRAAEDAWSNVVTVEVLDDRLGAVRRVRATRTRHGAARVRGTPVLGATSYRLSVARSATCAKVPRPKRFAVVAEGLTRPAGRLKVDARAIWLRLVGVRGSLVGELRPSSTDCVRLRR
jgi:lysophospholipase L1-like esterase